MCTQLASGVGSYFASRASQAALVLRPEPSSGRARRAGSSLSARGLADERHALVALAGELALARRLWSARRARARAAPRAAFVVERFRAAGSRFGRTCRAARRPARGRRSACVCFSLFSIPRGGASTSLILSRGGGGTATTSVDTGHPGRHRRATTGYPSVRTSAER